MKAQTQTISSPFTHQVQTITHPVTPDQPRRELSRVLERLARAICAVHNECQPTDGYTNKHWPSFLPGAKAAYTELLRIDEERATNYEKENPHE